jgi:hypothetical protein
MRKFVALVVAGTLCVLTVAEPLLAKAQLQSQNTETTKANVRYLHARGSEIEVTLSDGTRLRGRIISVEDNSFTIKERTTGREIAWQYAQVIEVKKKRISGAKAALIGAIIGGGVLLVLCAAPFPLGFLCQEDPC